MANSLKFRRNWATIAGAALLIAGHAPVSAQAPAKATPWLEGEFTVDPYHTFANFEYDHFGLSTGRGRFDKTEGTITIAKGARTAVVDITIQVASVNTGVALLDSRLKSPAFFDAEKYPTIRFRSDDFRFTGDALTEVAGTLTIKDVTKPVTLKVKRAACKEERNPTLKYPACGADAVLTINRSDYNVGAFAPLVSDKIEIAITVEALKGKEAIEAQFQPFKR
jgi:polyisoprenoid-binding protein YceI